MVLSLPEPKVQVIFSDHRLSVVRPAVCLLTFHIFDFYSKTTVSNLNKFRTNHTYEFGILDNC